MAIILDKYAIKEVADVMFYELDSKGAPSAPVLYLDTLKTSTLSQSSETVDARGGKGNVKLLTWDTNKELTLELTDALFSAKSLGIMFGGTMKDNSVSGQEVLKTLKFSEVTSATGNNSINYWKFTIKDATYAIDKTKCSYFVYATGETDPSPVTVANATKGTPDPWDFVTFDLLDAVTVAADGTIGSTGIISNGITIDITSNFNSNTYYITGDTYARNFQSGQDEFLQFIIPKGKVSAEDVSLTMEADGDPAEFAMTVQCLKANDGSMVKLVKYSLGESGTGDAIKNKGVASVLDHYNGPNQRAAYAAVSSGDPWDASTITAASGSLTEGSTITDEN